MKKVLSFSLCLMLGLLVSQVHTGLLGEHFGIYKQVVNTLLYVCLAFIMINVGREFELDKSRWRTYTKDYFVAMATAAMPWLLIAVYYVFVLLPPEVWGNGDAWKENLLLSRFAAPTSAGILFTMLAALGLRHSWIYKKIQVLAIFDDLDTILLMIPLQIAMMGLQWQMGAIVAIVFVLLLFGWRKLGTYDVRQDWKAILFYAVVVFAATQAVYLVTGHFFGESGGVHVEVLLPAFVAGMVMKSRHVDSHAGQRVTTAISLLFMFLVGVSMPQVSNASYLAEHATSITATQPMMGWGTILLHVVAVSALSNIGKLVPMLFYRDRSLGERLALSIGMFTRGEVGAGVIFIALGYNLGGPALVISALTLVLNLVLTGGFVVVVKHLALKAQSGR